MHIDQNICRLAGAAVALAAELPQTEVELSSSSRALRPGAEHRKNTAKYMSNQWRKNARHEHHHVIDAHVMLLHTASRALDAI